MRLFLFFCLQFLLSEQSQASIVSHEPNDRHTFFAIICFPQTVIPILRQVFYQPMTGELLYPLLQQHLLLFSLADKFSLFQLALKYILRLPQQERDELTRNFDEAFVGRERLLELLAEAVILLIAPCVAKGDVLTVQPREGRLQVGAEAFQVVGEAADLGGIDDSLRHDDPFQTADMRRRARGFSLHYNPRRRNRVGEIEARRSGLTDRCG